jgi:Tfp pilus assembly protein PilX
MKSPICNQKGIALITTLVMLVLALGVVAILLQLTTRATRLTGLQQGYTTALNQARAGADSFINTALNFNSTTHTGTVPSFPPAAAPTTSTCLNTKLFTTTSAWGCASGAAASTPDATSNPDIKYTVGNDTVYIKIIDTTMMAPNPADTACNSSTSTNGCIFYTVLSTATGPTGKATVQFVYRVTY